MSYDEYKITLVGLLRERERRKKKKEQESSIEALHLLLF